MTPKPTTADRQAGQKEQARRSAAPSIRQLLDMQDILYAAVQNSDATPKDCAACALAWERLEERKRILRNRPLPGSLKPEAKSKLSKPTIIRPLPDEP